MLYKKIHINHYNRILFIILLSISMVSNDSYAKGKSSDLLLIETRLPEKLVHGLALFDSLQGRLFSSLSTLYKYSSYKSKNSSVNLLQPETIQLFGDLFSKYGLHRQASKLYYKIIRDPLMISEHDMAWYSLAHDQYKRGVWSEVSNTLDNIGGNLNIVFKDQLDEMVFYSAIHNKNFRKAKTSLVTINEQDWAKYAQFNLASSLAKNHKKTQAITLLHGLTQIITGSSEYLALRDRSNLTLGYIFLQQNKTELAIKAFNDISLAGISSNNGLLGLGFAMKQKNHADKALMEWSELTKKQVSDSAVQKALYLIPAYLEKIKKFRLAIIHYKNANKRYELEIATLDEIIGLIKQGELLRYLKSSITNNTISLESKELNPSLPKILLYLSKLLATSSFQKELKKYRDIVYLDKIIDKDNSRISFIKESNTERKKLLKNK